MHKIDQYSKGIRFQLLANRLLFVSTLAFCLLFLTDLTGVGHDHSVMDDSSSNLLSSGVSSDELDQLKMDTMTCINDSLFNKLHEIEQVSYSLCACLNHSTDLNKE